MKIATIIGSLRAGSNHRAMFNFLAANPPAGVEFVEVDISTFNVYNGDVEAKGVPQDVRKASDIIHSSDGVLFFVPEYNYSMSGATKNAIDWISRVTQESTKTHAFALKPAGMISGGGGGRGLRAQANLRQAGVFLRLDFLALPEAMVNFFDSPKFTDGKLTDEATQNEIIKYATALKDHIISRRK